MTLVLLYIQKNRIVLEVSCRSETVFLNPIAYFSGDEFTAHSLAKSEGKLCSEHLKSLHSPNLYEALKTFFEGRGWQVVEFKRI